MELREKIMEATIEEFNERSLKFKMDDISKKLEISKKTIYTMFPDKETLFLETVDYCFTAIKESEKAILMDSEMDLVEKIKRVLVVLPERYVNIDWRQIYVTKEKYPRIYRKIQKRIETDWEPTIALLEEAISQGRIRPISIPVLKVMVEASIEHFLSSKLLIDQNISYEDALNEMIDIMIDGIKTDKS